MKEREFLRWLECKQAEIDSSDNSEMQSLVNQIKIKFVESFNHELSLFAPHEIIEDCLRRNGMKAADLSDRGTYTDEVRMRVIKDLFSRLSHVYTKTAIADMLNISPNIVYWATNQSKA